MSNTALIPIIIIFAILIVLVWVIGVRNSFIVKRNRIEESRSGIEVALTKRFDMLTKMLDVAKSYAKHEEKIFTKVIQMRSGMSLDEMQKADASMTGLSNGLMAVAEAYPQLRSDSVFCELQSGIRDAEEHLQAARRAYNSNVTEYNTSIEVFPGNIIARMNGLSKETLYQAPESSKMDVKMDFGEDS